jgi:hypothetical protein
MAQTLTLSAAARLASLAYASAAEIGSGLGGLNLVLDAIIADPATDTRGFYASCPAFDVCFIKGTRNLADFRTDARIRRVPIAPEWSDALVHEGFHGGWMGVREQVMPLAMEAAYTRKPLYIGGHSLGGGITTIGAADLAGLGSHLFAVTFGSPRVGNRAFAAWYGMRVKHTIRCVHLADIVPHVPWLGYWHVPGLLHLRDDGRTVGRTRSLWRMLKGPIEAFTAILDGEALHDHLIDTAYLPAILAYEAREQLRIAGSRA